MTIPLIKEDEEIIDFMKQYVKVEKTHLQKIFKSSRLEKLIKSGLLKEEGLSLLNTKGDTKLKHNHLSKAVEVLIHLWDKVEYHTVTDYPFAIYIIMKGKGYDVAYIEPGSEPIISQVINRSQSEKVIAILDDIEQAAKMSITKPVRYCVIRPEVEFFEQG